MQYIIDRFEGNYAVCEREDGKMEEILSKNFPQDAKEGDVFTMENGAVTIDKAATMKRREEAERLFRKLMKSDS